MGSHWKSAGGESLPDAEFVFSRDIHVDVDDVDDAASEDAAEKRLSNMGYCTGAGVAENVSAFQRDARQSITGALAQVVDTLTDYHDRQCRPPG